MLARDHILARLRPLKANLGLLLTLLFVPMVLSGYGLQVSTDETDRHDWAWLHVVTSGLWVAGSVVAGGQDPAALDLTGPLALVMGREQKGIRPGVRKACDVTITKPTISSPGGAVNGGAAAAAGLDGIRHQGGPEA